MLFLSAAMDRNGIFDKWTNWELWPFSLRYLAISPAWLWFSFRARSFWFFTPSNPTITFGGFEGEGKKEMYDQLPQEFVPKTIYAFPHQSFEEIQQQLAEHGFTYPFCVKPEVGMKGLLFRKIDKEEHLRIYHAAIPFCYIIQELVDYPIEVSVFYYRFPHQQKGVITGFIKKELMEVVGDGAKTVIQLIQEHPNARYREEEMRMKHAD
ncbi:MAG TPA: hypothetical protein VEZ55_14390, partial [Chitinophagaceae bacterium]|nr:hypothetical protein [Chitinophagaceae bacterium]